MSETRVERRERERREEEQRLRSQQNRDRKKQSKREKERKKKRRKQIGGIVAIAIAVFVVFMVWRVWSESRLLGDVEPIVMAGSGEFEDPNRVNILFLGANQGLTDTIMLFSLNFDSMHFDQISIPRDTYYYRPAFSGAAYQKINSVYNTEGYIAAAKAVSNVLGGIPIHYYVVLEPDGVKRIVDTMGGVSINVPMDMHYVDVDQDLYIDLQAGTQLLTGDQAMQYLRFRSGYPMGDLDRITAQQAFLGAVLSQSGGLDLLQVAFVARSEAETNMSMTAQAGLMTRAAGLQSGAFSTHVIPGAAGMQDGLSYYFHDAAGTKELMRSIYAG